MLSKNNRHLQEQRMSDSKQRFSIRKYSFGAASVLLGLSFLTYAGGNPVSADTTDQPATVTEPKTTSTDKASAAASEATASTATSEARSTVASEATKQTREAVSSTATSESAAAETTQSSKTASKETVTSEAAKESTATSEASKTSTATSEASEKASTATNESTTPATATSEENSQEQTATSETADANALTASKVAKPSALKSVKLVALKSAKFAALKSAPATTAITDDSLSSSGEITTAGKDKGLTDSDVTPGMSDANGASLKADNSNIPDGYKADPTEDRYTFGIISLGGDYDKWGIDKSKYKSYNGENNTNYYIRLSTKKTATDGTYDDTVYAQVVDATTDTVKWEQTLTPNSGAVKINNGTDGFELSSLVNNVTQYYEINYTYTKIGNALISRVALNPNNGQLTSLVVYRNGKAVTASEASAGTYVSVSYPTTGTIETEYIAKDAADNETTLATYEKTGRQGYKYTISGSRVIKGYDLISSPSTTTGVLGKTYNVGDVYPNGNLEISDQLQLARVLVVTSNDGYAKVELRVALKKDANGNAITIASVNDSSIWKTILSTDSLAPNAYASNGNYGSGSSWYINATNGTKYITDAGFTEEQLAGYKKHLTVIVLANDLTDGQEPAKYYYAPQGQVRINYVTSDGKALQAPTTAYENSSAGTSYDAANYRPATITVNGKTYHWVKSDKSLGTPGTTTINGYTYNVTPSDATGTISSTTVNDVYYVYEPVTYTLNKDEESKKVTRTINYVDSVTGEAIPSELEPSVTQTATLTRSVIYDDQGNRIGYGTVSKDGTSYTLDDSWKVADQTWTEQKSADLSDYGYTAPDKETVAAENVDGSTTDTVVTVYYGHQTTPVKPTDPKTPGEPINPKGNVNYPDGVSKDDLTSTVKRTINYVDEDGNKVNGSPDGTSSYEQTAEFTRTAIVDKVTGKILGYDTNNDGKVDTESADRAWQPTSKTLEAVKSADPSSVGYDNVDISNVSSLVVTPGQGDTTVTVTYSNNQVSGTIKYIDDTTGVELDSDNLKAGKIGSIIDYKTEDKIKSYEDQGYELVSNDFTDGSQVYKKTGNDFVVHLKHKTQTITPNDPNPVTPGEPINPNDPNSPVYGEETDRKNLVKNASQTIHYVGAGDKTPADNVVTQKDAFTRTVTIDKVTGKVLSYTDWEGEKTFNTVDTPVVNGYHADKKVAGGLTATVDNPDVEETVTYSPNGKIVPVDPNNTPIPGADTPTYPTDPNDPTKVVPNEPIPEVPGWNPVDPSPVTPSNPGEDTPVPYNQVVTGTIKYVDDTTGKTLSSKDLPEGTVGSTINYTTAEKIKSYEDQGYEFVESNFTDGSQVYAKDGNDFVVHLKHATEQTTSYKDASQTIHYVGAGDDTPADKVQTQKDAFSKTDTIDKVTGEVVKTTGWTGTKTFGTEDTPVVNGYHADKKVAGGLTATVDNPDVEETVTYSPNGKLVPVDPNGTPIPGADTPTYPTDPNDPTKVVPNEPTPEVPGWTTDVPNVTPEDPTKDTPVPYTKKTTPDTPATPETPAAKYGLTEKFVDENGNELQPSVNKGTDYKTGDSYDVTKDAKVVEGYVLVKTTDTTGTFTDGNKTAVFTYKKIGKIIPVDENGTPIPGADTPSYKNDPTDPTKVLPNEPTPEVPGWTTDVPNVTPADPTADTPVPYAKKTTPSTPEVPSTPDTPSNPETLTTPDKPEVPSQPQKPATPSGQNNPTPVNPTTTPASPKQTTLTGKQTPAPSKTVTANQLPQTGADEEKAILLSALGLGLVTLTSLFGLLGGKKRKH